MRGVRAPVAVKVLCGFAGLEHHKAVKKCQRFNAREGVYPLPTVVFTERVSHPNQQARTPGVGGLPCFSLVGAVGHRIAAESTLVARHIKTRVAPGIFAVGPTHHAVVANTAFKVIRASTAYERVVALVAPDVMANARVGISRGIDHLTQQRAVQGHIGHLAGLVFVEPGFHPQAQVAVFETDGLDVCQGVGAITIGLAVRYGDRTIDVGGDGVARKFTLVLHGVYAGIAPLVERAIGTAINQVVARATTDPVATGTAVDRVIAFVAAQVVVTGVVVLPSRSAAAVANRVITLCAVNIGADNRQGLPLH